MSPHRSLTAQSILHLDMELGDLLRAQVLALGDSPAYVFLGSDLEASQVLSYDALGQVAESIAHKLRQCTRPGDRVLLAFSNDMEAVQLFWGCVLARVIAVPAPAPDINSNEGGATRLRGIATDAKVSLIFTDETHLEAGRSQIPDVPWTTLSALMTEPQTLDDSMTWCEFERNTDVVYLQYTSGSTNEPRGVQITHQNLMAQCSALMSGLDTHRKKGLTWLPWFHDYGLVHGVIQPLYSGATSFLMSTSQFMLRPLKWLEAVEKHRVTHSGAPNFAYAACVQALARAPGWTANLECWQFATCGAEPVRAATLDAFAEAFAAFGFNSAALAPSYGLAETVLAVTVRDTHKPLQKIAFDAHAIERHEVRPGGSETQASRTLVGCGPALPGFQLRIVDPDTSVPCAPDRIGEIWVAGPSVGQGYWGQSKASAECFGATLAEPGADATPYLRTGDLGFLHGGELFIAGRRKDLIVVNGRNLYPQDLERTAESVHPNIRPGGVVAISVDKGLTESVVLLVECSRRPSPGAVGDLMDGVQRRIAIEHQIDLHDIVPLRTGTLPRTSSGKPQRSAARGLYLNGALDPVRLATQTPSHLVKASEHYPNAALIDTLIALWCDVLGREAIEPTANFFDLGGDSLLATQLVSRLRTRLGVDLPIRCVFESPTVIGLARRLAEPQTTLPHVAITPTGVVNGTPGPCRQSPQVGLSFSQERMWFMHQLAPSGSAYNIPLAIRLFGELDMPALNVALTQVVERHDILRTRFVSTPEGPMGEVVAIEQGQIGETWIDANCSAAAETVLHAHLAAAASIPFHLDQCPLLRVQVFHLGPQESVLLIVMHHIIGDQWSCAVLGRELAALYSAARSDTLPQIPTLPIQYSDYADSHRRWFLESRHDEELAYWSRRLSGLEPLVVTGDFPRTREPNPKGAALRIPYSKGNFASLSALGAAHGASLSMVLITALKVLLLRHTGKTDIAIGVPIANRNHLASEALIGTFVNTLVFRTGLQGTPSFVDALRRVRDTALEAFEHQDMPFELLVRELKVRNDPSRSALFSVAFNLINSPARDVHFSGLEWSRLTFDRQAAQFDLSVSFDALYDPCVVLEYATDLFARSTIEHMGEHLMAILQAACQTPDIQVDSIDIIGEKERSLLQLWSSGPHMRTQHEVAGMQVAAGLRVAPERTALLVGDTCLSHGELDGASNRLARALRRAGVGRGASVGLFMPRQPELIVGLVAILKSGAAYLPLDPAYPQERLAYQVADAGVKVLLTSMASEAVARVLFKGPVWVVDSEHHRFESESPAPMGPDSERDANSEDPAYLIYTSGSTGQPKGVAVPHRALVNLIDSMGLQPGMNQDIRLLAVTTLSFDIAVTELLLPLAFGARVVMTTESQGMDGRQLAQLIDMHDINVMQATPSRWNVLLDAGWEGRSGLRALVTGEPLPRTLANELCKKCGEVWNMYGPTETTVFSSGWRVEMDTPTGISLGRPIANTTISILDPEGTLCPIGVMGEIWIGGAGLALGYHERPELTASRFVELPQRQGMDPMRMYRTGDFGRWRWDGSLEHGGRMDDQVKLRGFRIELGEVEAGLATSPGVQHAVVALKELPCSGWTLVGYIVPTDAMPLPEEVRQHLRKRLPDHMIPTVFMQIDRVPVLENGKTNRGALPLPPQNGTGVSHDLALPRTHAEQLVWSVWSDLFQTKHLGVHDEFFAIGGHSLMAVRLAGLLEKVMQRPIPLGLLFTHTTIADLAAAISADRETPDLPVALLQPLGESPPLFLLAGADMYRALAHQLKPDIPVYGLFSQEEIALLALTPDQDMPSFTVESLADAYLTLVRNIRPSGPYLLGGFSIGGIIAYEVARRLRSEGEDVRMLILLDCAPPGRGAKHLAEHTRRRLRELRDNGLKYLVHVSSVLRHETIYRSAPGQRRIKAYARAIGAYRAQPYDAPVLLVQSQHDPYAKPGYGWGRLAPQTKVERVPGRHMTTLEPTNAALLAQHLKRHLSIALARLEPQRAPRSEPANGHDQHEEIT